MTFNELNLSAPVLRAVAQAGYESPSPIQAAAIPPVLAGRGSRRGNGTLLRLLPHTQ